MDWLQENAELMSALATVLMTIAWVTYAQFAIMTYIKQRRPRIIIDQTADHSINTRFVIVNLSEMAVYITGIIVCVRRGEDEVKHKIANYQRFSGDVDDQDNSDSDEDIEAKLRHGTLDAGELFLMGSSNETLSWLLQENPDEETRDQPRGQRLRQALSEIDYFEFRVLAMVGTDDRVIASSRSFQIERSDNDDILIVPRYGSTLHFTSWWDRKVAEQWSEDLRKLNI